ncbi:hypothetical protein P4159_00365 [Bacillus thuringiensis]|uniref:DUF4316 domain-containing protein n=1 Tax=Bacillus thuringiensis subsp. kurstaki TaxID=29339 RepID=Q3YN06_BACTK|nr:MULTISPECIES: hypothetical protein [Bacillus cereus group]MEB9963565.1 hypothetical protein [Bacillus cereus]AAZ06639.1 hypothetical protein pAW63_069 [Bacillus thuringiensis serovar kurstaki]AGE81717.1 hypothetical protein HD73_7570 [Bacillus thuringiensis serovar kurstaki str. HD73]AND11293.1 hypothetical protein Bt4C1_28995 [Bacillus thuringiensis serovar alesti]EJV73189.1 hypothetical protein IG1_05847 [Bacillus cereus HD73]
MTDNHEVVTAIQQKTALEIEEKLGIDLDKHWENYEIQLSEDNRVIEEIHPDMRLSLGEMLSVVNRCGTEKEMETFNQIADYLEPYYEADLIQGEFYEMPIAKLTTGRQQNVKVECLSQYVSDSDIKFDFNDSIFNAVNHISHSITKSHNEIMNGDVEYQGLYPVNENMVIYCESTGKPLQQDEAAYHFEGYGYVVAEEVSPEKLAPIRYMEEKKIEDGELRFNPVEEIVNDRKGETEEVFQMESAKTVGSVKKEHGAIEVQESKTIPDVGKRYIGKDTIHEEEQQQVSQKREQARKQHMLRLMGGRDY